VLLSSKEALMLIVDARVPTAAIGRMDTVIVTLVKALSPDPRKLEANSLSARISALSTCYKMVVEEEISSTVRYGISVPWLSSVANCVAELAAFHASSGACNSITIIDLPSTPVASTRRPFTLPIATINKAL